VYNAVSDLIRDGDLYGVVTNTAAHRSLDFVDWYDDVHDLGESNLFDILPHECNKNKPVLLLFTAADSKISESQRSRIVDLAQESTRTKNFSILIMCNYPMLASQIKGWNGGEKFFYVGVDGAEVERLKYTDKSGLLDISSQLVHKKGLTLGVSSIEFLAEQASISGRVRFVCQALHTVDAACMEFSAGEKDKLRIQACNDAKVWRAGARVLADT
jgi:hypothetical protein